MLAGTKMLVHGPEMLHDCVARVLREMRLRWSQLNQQHGPSADVISETVALLVMARAIVQDETRWTQRDYRTGDGRFSIVGALYVAAGDGLDCGARALALRLLKSIAAYRGYHSVEEMNDTCTHQEVLESIDAAITLASADAPTYVATRLLVDIGAALPVHPF